MPLPKQILARLQAFTRTPSQEDLIAFLQLHRDNAIADLIVVDTQDRMFRAQGYIAAIDQLASDLEHLRLGPDIVDDAHQENVVIPSAPGA